MLSMGNFFWLVGMMFIFSVLTVGIIAGSVRLYSLLRKALCGARHRDPLASVITGIVILASLMLLPQPGINMPALNVLLYIVFGVLGLVHLVLWGRPLLAIFASAIDDPECCCHCGCRCGGRCKESCKESLPCGCPGECTCSCPGDPPSSC